MEIPAILRASRAIAAVGLSDKPGRPSFQVAAYLLEQGYTIIPVNPNITEWKGLKAYPSLSAIPASTRVDVVDVFRRSEDVPPVVDEAIKIRAKTVWMQPGIMNGQAAEKAREAGLDVVMGRCMKLERMKLRK